jgi:hypothetical protein
VAVSFYVGSFCSGDDRSSVVEEGVPVVVLFQPVV